MEIGDLYWYEKFQFEVVDMEVDEAWQWILSAGVKGKK